MTGSIPDPRLEATLRAVGAHFQHDPEWYREGVAIALIAADAHDEASGVRRVTAQELADNLELARAEERQRLADAILPDHWQTMQLWGGVQRLACGRCRYGDGVRYLWPCRTRRAITGEPEPEPNSALLSAADSPVGGVS